MGFEYVKASAVPGSTDRLAVNGADNNFNVAGLATLVGLITPVTAFLGADAAVHMAEELKNASKTLPRVMVWTSIVNGSLGFVMLM